MTRDDNGQSGGRRRRLLSAGRRILGGLLKRGKPVPEWAEVAFVGVDGRVLKSVEVETGDSLLRVARKNGVDISSYCGGQCSCGTCRVVVEQGAEGLTRRTPNEAMVLGDAQVRGGERLACQARVVGDVRVRLLDLF